jgi:hypothetical protein
MKTENREIKEVEFGIIDTHNDDLLHEFGCHKDLAVVAQELAKMKLHKATDYLRYEIAVFMVHDDQGDDEVNCVATFRIDAQYLNFLEGK